MFNKFRGKHSEQKAKKLNRDVISYEEVPLEDYEEQSTKVSVIDTKKIIKIVILLLALALIIFIFANRQNFTPENISNWFTYDVLGQGGGTGYPTKIVGTNVEKNNIVSTGNTLSYASDTSFVTLSSNASEIQNYQLNYATPSMSNNGSNVIVYSLGGKTYDVGTTNEITYTGKTEEAIYACDVSNSGVYGVVTDTTGYLSKLYIYNKDHKQIYAYSFSDYYVTTLSISPDGNQCVVTGISAEAGSMTSAIYVLDFNKEEPVSVNKITNNTIYRTEYLTGNEVCLIGNTASLVLNISDNKLAENSYNKMTLTSYDINESTGNFAVSLSRSGDGHSCTVQAINSRGEIIADAETQYKISALTLFKGNMYFLENNTVHCYDFNKNEISKGDSGTGAKQISVTTDGSVYVLGVNEIRKIEMK